MQELLALGESIGDVNTGLSNEIICTCLSESKYSPLDATLAMSNAVFARCVCSGLKGCIFLL